MNNVVIYALWSALAGALVPVLAASNGTLGRAIGSPLYASFFGVVIAVLAVGFVLLVLRPATPSVATLKATPLWVWIGGLSLAFYAISATFLTPRFGVGNFVMCVVIAQLVVSSAIDQFGLFGVTQHSIELKRALGLGVLCIGAALVALK